MSRERQYTILSQAGTGCGSVWADEVTKRANAKDGFWFKRDGEIVGSSWYGYLDHSSGRRIYLPQSANAEEPVTVEAADGSAKV